MVVVSAGFADPDCVLCAEWAERPSGKIPVTERQFRIPRTKLDIHPMIFQIINGYVSLH